MIKLVVSDMDGTLLNTSGEISKKNREAIKKLSQQNIEFAIASGRDYSSINPILKDLDIECEAILGNGAQYVDKQGNILMNCYMDKGIYKDVVKVFDEAHIPYMVFTTQGFYAIDPIRVSSLFVERCVKLFGTKYEDYQDGGVHASTPSQLLKPINDVDEFLKEDFDIIKVEAFSLDVNDIVVAKEKLKDIPLISYLSSFDDNVEVTDEKAQKGLILEKVAEIKNLKKEEIVVLGDGMNDITLFQHFPYSFAPKNATQDILNLAYKVVADCEDDGFCEGIDMILEGLFD